MIVCLTKIKKEYIDIIENETGEKIHVFNNMEEARNILHKAEIIIAWGLNKDLVRLCQKLKWFFNLSAGVEMLPFDELISMGTMVTNVRGLHGPQMAEQIMGMIISFSRRLNRMLKNQLQKKWNNNIQVDQLSGKTICIIGAGSIGREVARKARAFDMRVIGLKKHVEDLDNFDEVWGMEKLYDALKESDYNVLVTPLTDETYHLIGKKEFKLMKNSSIFINVSRGDTVNEGELIEALKKGHIAGAGLDVFHQEPLDKKSPLWDMENVIITPHNCGISPHHMKKTMNIFKESLICYRLGNEMPGKIDLNKKY